MLLKVHWRCVKSEGTCLLGELLIALAFLTPCDPKESPLKNITVI